MPRYLRSFALGSLEAMQNSWDAQLRFLTAHGTSYPNPWGQLRKRRTYFDIWDTMGEVLARGPPSILICDMVPEMVGDESVEDLVQKNRFRVIARKFASRWRAFVLRHRSLKWRRALKLRIVPRTLDCVRNVLATKLAALLPRAPRWETVPSHPANCDSFYGPVAVLMRY